jgi:hypothetical protein
VLAAAQELAELVGLDVDTFIAMVVLELRHQESSEGRLQARRDATTESSSTGHVITMADRGKRRGRSQPRMD